MTSPYAPPTAAIRDTAPEGPGPLHDALAIVAGVFLIEFLSIVVAEEIVWALVFLLDIPPDSEELAALTLDLAFSFGFTLFGFWAAWRLSRSRRLRVPAIVGAICVAITFANRWVLNDYGWPVWYEVSLLLLIPAGVAVMAFFLRRRQRLHAP